LAVRTGDHAAFQTLYNRYSGSVVGVAQSVVRDRAVAEDIAHDVFLNFWRNPEAYEPTRGQYVAWLLRVTRNRAIDVLRKRKPVSLGAVSVVADGEAIDTSSWIPDPDPLPDQQAVTTTTGEHVRQALLALPEDHRRLLEMAYFGGLTQREIAERTGKPLGTVKTQMRTSMMRLAKMTNIRALATSSVPADFVGDERSLTSKWNDATASKPGIVDTSTT
jgi:RNA polymerase sigma-70 factor (ECF subfamily)